MSFFALHVPLVAAHLKAGMKWHLCQPSILQNAVVQGCRGQLGQGHCPQGAAVAPSCPHHKPSWPPALGLPWTLFYLSLFIPPWGLPRTPLLHWWLLTTHSHMGTWQKLNISAQKIKIQIGKAFLAAALPRSRRFKGSSEWKSLSGAVSFFLEAVF